jgi:hypothetical protein
MTKVITDYSHNSDADLDTVATTIVTDCNGNANFKFVNGELDNAAAAQTNYHTKLAELANGGPQAVTAKDMAKKVLQDALSVLCQQINIQCGGDKEKAQSSGAPLAKTPTVSVMPVPTGLVVKYNDVSGSVDIKVDTPNVSDHGTIFAYTLATNAPTNLNDWKLAIANGHKATIKGLTAGQTYAFAAAYKGRDEDDLIWCPAINKMVV